MTTMKLFNSILGFKKKGWSNRKIARKLKIDRKTVSKYLKMTAAEYLKYKASVEDRGKFFDKYLSEILEIYAINEDAKNRITISSIYDLLLERHKDLPATERSLRNYIRYLAKSGKLDLKHQGRPYMPVPELPPGKQMQLDFGEYEYRSKEKTYIFAALLSNSRKKFVAVQKKPFTAMDVILLLLDCFEYFEGIPEELVIDQDRTMVVSENHGDIIYTKQFKYFQEEMGFKMHVCRGADPESKGKVENLVKFVKSSFFSARIFDNFEEMRERLGEWLEGRANGRISQATLQIPAIAFETEKKYLKPLRSSIFKKIPVADIETRKVDKQSLISLLSCKYSVPCEYRLTEVGIKASGIELFIYDLKTNIRIAKHKISLIPGKICINRDHYRDKTGKIQEKLNNMIYRYELPEWQDFVKANYKKYKRYFRDQLAQAEKILPSMSNLNLFSQALKLCLDLKHYSFMQLYDTYRYYQSQEESDLPDILKTIQPILKNIDIREKSGPVSKRNVSYYSSLLKIITTSIVSIGGII